MTHGFMNAVRDGVDPCNLKYPRVLSVEEFVQHAKDTIECGNRLPFVLSRGVTEYNICSVHESLDGVQFLFSWISDEQAQGAFFDYDRRDDWEFVRVSHSSPWEARRKGDIMHDTTAPGVSSKWFLQQVSIETETAIVNLPKFQHGNVISSIYQVSVRDDDTILIKTLDDAHRIRCYSFPMTTRFLCDYPKRCWSADYHEETWKERDSIKKLLQKASDEDTFIVSGKEYPMVMEVTDIAPHIDMYVFAVSNGDDAYFYSTRDTRLRVQTVGGKTTYRLDHVGRMKID